MATISKDTAAYGVEAIIKLKSIDEHIKKVHGRYRSLLPTESAILTDYGQKILRHVVDRWPVDTGTSRDRWSVTEMPLGGDLGLRIYNPITYVQYVHRAGTPKTAILWGPMISKAWATYKNQLVADLKAEIDKTEQRLQPEQFTGPQIEGSSWAAIQARFALAQAPDKALNTFARIFRNDPPTLRRIEKVKNMGAAKQKTEIRKLAEKVARGDGYIAAGA